MKLFGKKDEDAELEDELEEDLPEKKKPKAVAEPKKRKPKPWTRKERYTLLIFMSVTIIPSAILFVFSNGFQMPSRPKLSLKFDIPKLSDYFKGDTVVLEGGSGRNYEVLNEIKKLSTNYEGTYGMHVLSLEDGEAFGFNENLRFEPASLNKLYTMYTAYRLASSGSLNLDTSYRLRQSDKTQGAGVLQSRPVGEIYTFRQLLELMGKKSDNTAYVVMKRQIGDEEIYNTLQILGLRETGLGENYTTPKDISNLLLGLFNSEALTQEYREEFLDNLTDTDFDDWLLAGVPQGTKVSHKFGIETNVLNDAGIVFSENPYIIVIMGKGVDTPQGEFFVRASKIIYNHQSSLRY